MENRICLDTDFLIDVLRNKKEAVLWLKEVENNYEVSTTMINIFELYSGAYKVKNSTEKIKSMKKLVENLDVLGLTFNCAENAGKIRAELEVNGKALESRDILIAAIALINNCSLKTNNKKHFSRIKGLKII